MKKILIPVLLILCHAASAQTFRTTVTAPVSVSMSVFGGFADSTVVITPVSKTVNGSTATYVFNLENGNYHFVSSGYDFNTLKKNFLVKGKPQKINADPGRMSEKGYQNKETVYAYTDELNATGLSVTELSKRFPKVLSTPAFNPAKPVQEHTTQREMEEYLDKLDKSSPTMYTFTAGFSTKGRMLPFAVFTTTDLSGMSLEQAGAAVRTNGKPTVFLHAEIHGNEASPGEAALSMCAELCGSYGARVLPHVNVMVIPRVNCDGIREWTRGTSIASDMNRDNLLAKNPEIKATHKVYNQFLPDIVIDMHEYGVRPNYRSTSGYLDDAGITVGGNQNNSPALNSLQIEMMRYVEKTGLESGLRYWEYTQRGYSDQSPLHASHYYALRGSANFLIESPNGYSDKKTSFPRRVFTQFFAAHALIQYAIDNASILMSTCKADREYVTAAGTKLDGTNPIVLKHGQNEEAYTYPRSIFSFIDGKHLRDTTSSVRYYEVPAITRPRPAAYVIPKDVAKISRILEIMELNGITFSELPAGTKMSLRQYAQNPKWKQEDAYNCEKCAMLEPQETVFENGAYIFKTAQPSGIVLSLLMEPDVIMTDRFPITLVQANILELSNLYRADQL